jgi:NADH dehydrogenase
VHEISFDDLVLARGSATDFRGIPGVAENALPMKTLGDAMALRNHIPDVLEHADLEADPAVRNSMLTFVVAGGGFAGTETVAELHDFVRMAARFYSSIRQSELRVVLVHSGARIMPEIAGKLARYAMAKLQSSGIEIVLNSRVRSARPTWKVLQNQQKIVTNTLVWAAGVAPSPLIRRCRALITGGGRQSRTNILRCRVTPDCGHWAIARKFPTAPVSRHVRRRPSMPFDRAK